MARSELLLRFTPIAAGAAVTPLSDENNGVRRGFQQRRAESAFPHEK